MRNRAKCDERRPVNIFRYAPQHGHCLPLDRNALVVYDLVDSAQDTRTTSTSTFEMRPILWLSACELGYLPYTPLGFHPLLHIDNKQWLSLSKTSSWILLVTDTLKVSLPACDRCYGPRSWVLSYRVLSKRWAYALSQEKQSTGRSLPERHAPMSTL
jgi:hypothetical protein